MIKVDVNVMNWDDISVVEYDYTEKRFTRVHGFRHFKLKKLPLNNKILWISSSFGLAGFGIYGYVDDEDNVYFMSKGLCNTMDEFSEVENYFDRTLQEMISNNVDVGDALDVLEKLG